MEDSITRAIRGGRSARRYECTLSALGEREVGSLANKYYACTLFRRRMCTYIDIYRYVLYGFKCRSETSVAGERTHSSHESGAERARNKKNYEKLPPPARASQLYANKPLHATRAERDTRKKDGEKRRFELANRYAAPSLVTRSFIAIERTSRDTPPSLHRSDKRATGGGQRRTRKGTARRGNRVRNTAIRKA